jgi:nitrogen fixation/metabolism regulation signal transduction histidine kinase
MSEILNKLNEEANLALSSKTTEESMKHLIKAFALFSKETNRLENAYERLQQRFNQVNNQLEKSDKELRKKITDLNSISSYLNNILKNISQGILYIDLDGIVTTYNKSAEKILEIQETQVLFNKFWDNFKDDFFGFSMKNALNFGLCQKITYINNKCANEKKTIEVCTSFIYECPKAYQGIIVLLKDVTKIQKLKTLANRNDRLKELGQIAASVAHEIKNPLGAIRGYASLLYKDLERSKSLQNMISYILDGTKALERIVNNVLEYARPITLDPVSLDVCSLIKELIKAIKIDTSFSDKVKIQLNLPEPSFNIPADKELIKAAILNLIVNAYQAMDDIGYLNISVIKNNNLCLITISDTGEGIEEKDLENIFSPFFTTKQKGNGLGLSEANKIIQAHFGNLEVRSKLHKGTTFTITLPIKR